MGDERLRELERRFRETQAPVDEAACLVEQVRLGRLSRVALELAAVRGERAAKLAARSLPRAVLVIHVCASWNLLDRFLTDVLSELQPAHADCLIHTVDVDEDPGLAAALQILNVPTLVAFCAGEELSRETGARRERLQAWLWSVTA